MDASLAFTTRIAWLRIRVLFDKHGNIGSVSEPTTQTLPASLCDEISECGFFPELVTDSVALAVGGSPVRDYLVHYGATFSHDIVGRHLSVLVVTDTRLIVSHTDESPDNPEIPAAISSTESVPFSDLGTVSLTRVVGHPEDFDGTNSEVMETWLALNWGTARRLDMEPAGCMDPTCEADHGYQGSVIAEDMVIRMSPAADGAASVDRLVKFATTLQQQVR